MQSLKEKVGQMGELDIYLVTDYGSRTVSRDRVRTYIRDYKLGSFLNSPFAGDDPNRPWDVKEWRAAMRVIQVRASLDRA
jgi:hypothetical protein